MIEVTERLSEQIPVQEAFMGNLLDYIKWRGDLDLSVDGFNEVDGLVFSAFSYLRFGDLVGDDFQSFVTIQELSRQFFCGSQEEQNSRIRTEKDKMLLQLMGNSKRYGSLPVISHRSILDQEIEVQFAAYTIGLERGLYAVIFRGTDHTLVGWKEDMNLGFMDELPGQKYAMEYLKEATRALRGRFIVCGHSKGGNLSLYSGASLDGRTQRRLVDVYNYDGPGFVQKFLETPGYQAIIPKIHTFVPQSSVVGMLLEHEEPYQVVKSSNMGISQHEPYSWEMEGPAFLTVDSVDSGSRFVDTSLRSWLAGLSKEDREEFVTAVYGIIMDAKPEKITDLTKPQTIMSILKKLNQADMQTKEMIGSTLSALRKSITEALTSQ